MKGASDLQQRHGDRQTRDKFQEQRHGSLFLVVFDFDHPHAVTIRACCGNPSARIFWNRSGSFTFAGNTLSDLAGLIAARAWDNVGHAALFWYFCELSRIKLSLRPSA
jgi:hypothetical protein